MCVRSGRSRALDSRKGFPAGPGSHGDVHRPRRERVIGRSPRRQRLATQPSLENKLNLVQRGKSHAQMTEGIGGRGPSVIGQRGNAPHRQSTRRCRGVGKQAQNKVDGVDEVQVDHRTPCLCVGVKGLRGKVKLEVLQEGRLPGLRLAWRLFRRRNSEHIRVIHT